MDFKRLSPAFIVTSVTANLMLAGGLVYSGGVAFYVWERLRYHHAIWHVFVLGGSILHFFAVLFYVIPGPPA